MAGGTAAESNQILRILSLPEPSDTTITLLATNPKPKAEFYAANNRGLFISTDSGISWRETDIHWPKEYSLQPPWTLAVRS
jgi:hypothetical protein